MTQRPERGSLNDDGDSYQEKEIQVPGRQKHMPTTDQRGHKSQAYSGYFGARVSFYPTPLKKFGFLLDTGIQNV